MSILDSLLMWLVCGLGALCVLASIVTVFIALGELCQGNPKMGLPPSIPPVEPFRISDTFGNGPFA